MFSGCPVLPYSKKIVLEVATKSFLHQQVKMLEKF